MMSDRVKLAMTVAGAIVLAFGIALSLDWQRPYWAGLAVVVIALPTMGESVFKGLQRLAGTAVAIPVALVFISLFAQERWLFALATSLWIAFCVWRMQVDPDRFYFWNCCGFIVPLLSIMSGFESARSFYTVETRAQETVLGIVCFIAVGLLLSHRSAYAKFIGEVGHQIALLHQKVGDVRRVAMGQERAADVVERNAAMARRFMLLSSLHTSATLESFTIRERASAWRQMLASLQSLATLLDRLDLSFDLGSGSTAHLPAHPELMPALDEIEARLDAVAGLVKSGGEKSGGETRQPRPIGYPAPAAGADTSPFERGEALFRHDIVSDADNQSRALQAAAEDIADKQRLAHAAVSTRPRWPTLIPDPEQLAVALMAFVVFWLAFLLHIFVPELPDGTVVVILAGSIGINLSRMPWIPAHTLLLPVVLASIYGSVAHIVIMPHLTGYAQLGTMLFLGIFLLVWLFHKEEHQSARTIAILLFLMITQVSNVQTYGATYAMNIVVAFGVIIFIITIAQHWPISFKPEHVVARLLDRYGHSLLGVLNGMNFAEPRQNGWLARQMRAYYMNQLLTIPARLGIWIAALSQRGISPEDRNELAKLTDRLSILSYRMHDLALLRGTEAEKYWLDALNAEVRAWRQGIQSVVGGLIAGDVFDPAEIRQRLDARLARFEQLIAETAQSAAGVTSDAGTAHMQRVLSAYRGVSFAVMNVADRTRSIAWDRLVEERF